MAKKDAWFWRGKGVIKIAKKLYVAGQPIPYEKLAASTFEALKKSGDIKKAPFDIIEDSTQVGELEKKVKELSEKLVEKNGNPDDVERLEGELETANGKVVDLEKDIEEKSALIDKLTKDLDEATKPAADTGGETGS